MASSASNRNKKKDLAQRAEPAFRQLCHVLSLSKTRKVQSAVDNLVLTTLSIDPSVGDGGDPNELALAISTYFGVEIDLGDVRLAIENHLKAGRLVIDRNVTPTRTVLSPRSQADLSDRINASRKLEDTVRVEWLTLAQQIAPDCAEAKLWEALQGYLGLVFNQHGVEAIELLDSRSAAGPDRAGLVHLLDRAINSSGLQSDREVVRSAVRAFFTEPPTNRLRYLSELLDGTFTFFALTVSDSTAEYLKGQVPSGRLFLDTNVALAVLGLQDNPLQEADLELLEIIRKEGYPLNICYHERTLREILEIVDAARSSLTRTRFTPALSRAYLQYFESRGGGFGLERRFHVLNAENELDVDAFLARFNHIEDLLNEQDITLYRQSGADLDTESKGEYIAEFEHFLAGRRKTGRRPRRYEALDHDVTIWMFLQRQRRKSTNALKTGALLLSNDYSLHAFDRAFLMTSKQGKEVATVVLPQHLLQILRPFNRVTVDFDKRFMEIFAAPEFRTTQTDYGPTVSKVMSYLASFDGVPTSTAVAILNDDLLIDRLKDADQSTERFGELIDSAIIDQNKALAEGREAAEVAAEEEREARESAEQLAAREVARAAELEEKGRELATNARKREEAESTARDEASHQIASLALTQKSLQEELKSERDARKAAEIATKSYEQQRLVRDRRILAIFVAISGVLGVIFIPGWIDWRWLQEHRSELGLRILASFVIIGLCGAWSETKHRKELLVVVVVGSIITLVSIL